MPIFYNKKGAGEEHAARPDGYADKSNGWVDPDYVAPIVPKALPKKKVVKKKAFRKYPLETE